MVVDPSCAGPRQHRREQRREREQRRREDHRDHTRLVDLQRDVGALAAVHAAADDTFRELHGYSSLPRLDRDDREDHEQRDHEDHGELEAPARSSTSAPWYGMRDTTDVKIRIDMPLPIPRWVMSSPSHITSAVPAVHVMTISTGLERGEVRDEHRALRELDARLAEQTAVAALQHEHERGRLHQRERDREVTRPLRDLLLPGLALVLPFLELRDHHAEQLHDDRRRDVRHDPEEEHRDAPSARRPRTGRRGRARRRRSSTATAAPGWP